MRARLIRITRHPVVRHVVRPRHPVAITAHIVGSFTLGYTILGRTHDGLLAAALVAFDRFTHLCTELHAKHDTSATTGDADTTSHGDK